MKSSLEDIDQVIRGTWRIINLGHIKWQFIQNPKNGIFELLITYKTPSDEGRQQQNYKVIEKTGKVNCFIETDNNGDIEVIDYSEQTLNLKLENKTFLILKRQY